MNTINAFALNLLSGINSLPRCRVHRSYASRTVLRCFPSPYPFRHRTAASQHHVNSAPFRPSMPPTATQDITPTHHHNTPPSIHPAITAPRQPIPTLTVHPFRLITPSVLSPLFSLLFSREIKLPTLPEKRRHFILPTLRISRTFNERITSILFEEMLLRYYIITFCVTSLQRFPQKNYGFRFHLL